MGPVVLAASQSVPQITMSAMGRIALGKNPTESSEQSHIPSAVMTDGDSDRADVPSGTASTSILHNNRSFDAHSASTTAAGEALRTRPYPPLAPSTVDASHLESRHAAQTIMALAGAIATDPTQLSPVGKGQKKPNREASGKKGSSSASPKATSRSSLRKQSPGERLQRSRERNRMHARKTRQRKKEHMKNLQARVDELKEEHLRLRQTINEKNTANILVGLFSRTSSASKKGAKVEDPKVEALLRRPFDEIPDSSKVAELPALILPGHHNSKRGRGTGSPSSPVQEDAKLPDDGIDYALLGKDRSKCTPAELDQIRRERNRMHAKRTRDRKRLFMEEMSTIIQTLESENAVLSSHLASMESSDSSGKSSPAMISPNLPPTSSPQPAPPDPLPEAAKKVTEDVGKFHSLSHQSGDEKVGAVQLVSSAASAVSASSDVSPVSSDHDEPKAETDGPWRKRQRTDKIHAPCATGPASTVPVAPATKAT